MVPLLNRGLLVVQSRIELLHLHAHCLHHCFEFRNLGRVCLNLGLESLDLLVITPRGAAYKRAQVDAFEVGEAEIGPADVDVDSVGAPEVDTGEDGPGEIGPEKRGQVEVGESEVGVTEKGVAEVGATEVSLAETGFAEVGPAEVGSAEVGFVEGGSAEVGVTEVCPAEVGDHEEGSAEVGVVEGGSAEVGVTEVGPAEIGATEVGPGEIGVTKEGSVEVGPAEVSPAEVSPAEVGPGEVGPWANRVEYTSTHKNPCPQPGIGVNILGNPLRVECYGAEGDDKENNKLVHGSLYQPQGRSNKHGACGCRGRRLNDPNHRRYRTNRARWRVERSSLLSQSNLDKLLSDVYWLFLTNAQKKLRPTQWKNSCNICTNTRDSEFSNDPVLEILRLLDPAELATRT